MFVELADKNHCTGCGLCAEICSSDAIRMEADVTDGFLYPIIDDSLCSRCGLCTLICPELKPVAKGNPEEQTTYALIGDDKIRKMSTSGGAFFLLADKMLSEGGAVVGVAYNKDLLGEFRIVRSKEELPKLIRSKYMQCNLNEIYGEIEKAFHDGLKILFCATPCQTAAMRRFAEEKGFIGQIILIDLICRGVPSPKAFRLHLDSMERRIGKKIVRIESKDKTKGWHKIGTRYTMEDGEEIFENGGENLFAQSFVGNNPGNLCIRESCFSCRYKTKERVSDLTIGDFWGMPDEEWDDDRGTSLVLVNTEKGREFFESIKEKAKTKEFSFSTARDGNTPAFSALPDNHKVREQFWQLLKIYDYHETMRIMEENRNGG